MAPSARTAGLWAREGFSSMHACCVEALGMSEGAAYERARAARVGRRVPAVVEAVRDGRPHLSAVLRLTAENHRALMAEASGKGKREVEEVVARWFPQPDSATSVRRLPTAAGGGSGSEMWGPAAPRAAPTLRAARGAHGGLSHAEVPSAQRPGGARRLRGGTRPAVHRAEAKSGPA